MTPMRSVLVWAVVLAVVGLAVWWLTRNDMAAGRWLFAVFLAGHGLVHLLFIVPAPAEATATWAFDPSRSWTAARLGADAGAPRLAGHVLLALTVAGFTLAALATMGWLIPTDWWRPLLAASSVASAALLGLYFNPQLILGVAIDAVLLWVALAGAWSP